MKRVWRGAVSLGRRSRDVVERAISSTDEVGVENTLPGGGVEGLESGEEERG
jgi:hypothetical protein